MGVFVRPLQKEEVSVKNRIIVVPVLLVVVFLAGFLPSYVKANRLENELREARCEHSLIQIRNLARLTCFQANQKDYGARGRHQHAFFRPHPGSS